MNASKTEQAIRALWDLPEYAQTVTEGYLDRDALAAAERFACSDEWTAVRRLLPASPGTALDLGAGRGTVSYAIAKGGWDVTAVEPELGDVFGCQAAIRLSLESGIRMRVVAAQGECMPFADRSFDVVLCRQVLHHVDDLCGLCREVFRVLRPGGRFLALREHVISRPEDLSAFLANHVVGHRFADLREGARLLLEYTEAIRASGLRLSRVLGPMDSMINASPLSLDEWRNQCLAPVFPLLGYRRARALGNPEHAVGRWVLTRLGRRISRRMNDPGRLYSFVADKR